MFNYSKLAAIGVALTLGLTACGGGGGGNSGFKAPNINHTPVSIDESNQAEVAQAGLDGATGSLDVGGAVPFAPVGVVIEGDSAEGNVKLYSFIRRVVTGAISNDVGSANGSSVTGVQFSGSEPCFVSGSRNFNGNISDPNGNSIFPGDNMTMSFDSCDDGDGEVVNGSMSITFNSYIADTNTFDTIDFDLTVSFNNFRSTPTGLATVTVHGSMDISTVVSGSAFTFTMSGDSFYVVEADEAVHLTNFDISFSYDEITFDAVLDSTFTVASTSLNGQITVDVYLEVPSGSLYPTTGYMTVTGNNSELSVVVAGYDSLNVDLTVGGSSVATYPRTNVTWSELGADVQSVM